MKKIKTFICPVQTIKYYLSKRNNNANHKIKNFSKTHREPFKAAHEDTISCWVKEVTAEAGIDITKYSPHSCRSASSAGSLNKGAHIDDVLKQETGVN